MATLSRIATVFVLSRPSGCAAGLLRFFRPFPWPATRARLLARATTRTSRRASSGSPRSTERRRHPGHGEAPVAQLVKLPSSRTSSRHSSTPGTGCTRSPRHLRTSTSRSCTRRSTRTTRPTPPAPRGPSVTEAYARELYLRWIGLSLAVEIGGHVPWSVTGYTAEQLQILFDSASFMSRRHDATYTVSASPEHGNYVNRKDILGGSLIAPPRFTLAFLRTANLVGGTRAATIAQLLDWCRDNLSHFYGARRLRHDGAALAVSRPAAHHQGRGRNDVLVPGSDDDSSTGRPGVTARPGFCATSSARSTSRFRSSASADTDKPAS